jgi:prepilin-type N-terminal cleavage/methylation domain-containing protein
MNSIRKVIKKTSATGGFTLFELMVAMVILAVGLFAIVQLGVVSVRGNGYSRERIEAMEIAQGVVDELKTRASNWVDNQTGVDPTFADIFPDLVITPTPNPGVPLAIGDLRPVQTYLSTGGVRKPIASDMNDPTGAIRINADGEQEGCDSLVCARAIYRVHYVAHNVRSMPPQGVSDSPVNPNLVRISIFVSWDSKDYGEKDYNWEGDNWWDNGEDFWKRHMVVVTTNVFRRRNW